ncbi:hypothetical protein [uncultured Ruminococcus sp.]|uniref:hypothetical protein n=1 Tax=uncultured Ruminococcus sp. TaxID=165186 RepID=UPI0025933F03|nr:hypothetical protein [uncultured Ruminococcus sp.]
MAFMSLALAMVAMALFILNLLRILGAVLLAGGCSARSKGHPVLATGLQCIGVILLIPVLLSMASIPVFFIICMLQ